MSQRTPPKSKTTPRGLIPALAILLRRLRSLDRGPDVGTQGGPTELLHAVFGEDLRLLVVALCAVTLELCLGIVRVRLVPLLLGPDPPATRQHDGARGEENAEPNHGSMIPCRRDARRDHSREPPETRVA